jgi:hypothetical protein
LSVSHAAARDDRGVRLASDPIHYRDTASGRVLVQRSGDYLSIAPAAPKLLARRLRELRSQLVR